MTDLSIISAFLVGLLSGVHCLGMCGGISSALSFSKDRGQADENKLIILSLYNLGRISSYTIAGVLFGLIGQFTVMSDAHGLHQILQTITAILFVLMGLYLGNWWRVLSLLERLGGYAWKVIQPLGRRFLPIRKPSHAFVVGLIWGWLPCGLVYSMLVASLGTGNAAAGGLLMLSFGLGTLPNLLLIGAFASKLHRFVLLPIVRNTAAILIILLGSYLLLDAWVLSDHTNHNAHTGHTEDVQHQHHHH